MNIITPITKLKNSINSNNIFVKREDLIPFSFGGNKVRIAQEYFSDLELKNKNCMIGYGNARSNLCRVLANMSCLKKIPCHIISPDEENGEHLSTMNSKMVETCGAVLHICSKNNVANTVEGVIKDCYKDGLDPYYINGDKYGKGNEAVPVNAYMKVFDEIVNQEMQMGVLFDYIFLATGTGMTQAGLLAGQIINQNFENQIVGISISRKNEIEKKIIFSYLEAYLKSKMIDMKIQKEFVNISDEFVSGGYGCYGKKIVETIQEILKMEGIALDLTYTGKAFWGMKEYLVERNISKKNILFIHTGGTPLFFDNIEKI